MAGALRLARLDVARGRRSSSALFVSVVALAAAALCAGSSVSGGADQRLDDAFRSGHGADIVVQTAPADVPTVSAALASLTGVASVAPAVLARSAVMPAGSDGRPVEHRVMVLGDDPKALGQPVVRRGQLPTSAGEVALDAGVAARFGVGTGDDVVLSDERGAPVTFRVSGTAYDFSDCFYPGCDPGRSWVTADGLARLGRSTNAVLAVDVADPSLAPSIVEQLAAQLPSVRFGADTWPDTRGDMLSETDFFASFLAVFGVFVLVASGLVIAAAMAARAVANRRRTGIAKAVGATPRQIGTALVLVNAGLAAIATIGGWILAGFVTPRLRVGVLRILTSDRPSFPASSLAVALVVVVGVVVVVSAVPAFRAGRVDAVEALLETPPEARRSVLGDALRTAGAPVTVELGARTWTRRRTRSASAAGALALAIVASIVTLSMNHTMDHLLAHPALLGDPWDAMFDPAPGSDRATVERALGDALGPDGWYRTSDDSAAWKGGRIHVRRLGGNLTAPRYVIGGGRSLGTTPGEAIVGYGVLNDEGWQVGDNVTLAVRGRPLVLTIVGWYRETEDSGRLIQVREDTLPGDYAPSYEVNAPAGMSRAELVATLRSIGGEIQVNKPDGATLSPFRTALATMSLMMVAVAIAHLVATSLLTARERRRTTAVLRAVGYDATDVAADAAVTAAFGAVCAMVVGLVAGLWLQGLLGDAITKGVGAGPGVSPAPPIGSVAVDVIALAIVAVAATMAVTVRVARQPVVALLSAD